MLSRRDLICIKSVLDEARPEGMRWLRLTALEKETYGKS